MLNLVLTGATLSERFYIWIATLDIWRVWIATLAVVASFTYRKVKNEKVSHGQFLAEAFLLYLLAYGGYHYVKNLPYVDDNSLMLAVVLGAPILRIKTIDWLTKKLTGKIDKQAEEELFNEKAKTTKLPPRHHSKKAQGSDDSEDDEDPEPDLLTKAYRQSFSPKERNKSDG